MMSIDDWLAHEDVRRLAQSLRDRPGRLVAPRTEERRAAIVALLRPAGADDLEILMIKRAEYDGDPWSGHVAFPGGRQEPGDDDLARTAIRETFEETGIDIASSGTILGALDELAPRTPVLPPLIVRPYVAVVGPEVEPGESDEVERAFWVPLAALRTPAQWIETTVQVRGGDRIVPSFRHGEFTVWGLTERALRDLMVRLG